jgi:hypothetical protein
MVQNRSQIYEKSVKGSGQDTLTPKNLNMMKIKSSEVNVGM